MKTCCRCGDEKPLTEYHLDKRRQDGRRGTCKECANLQANAHYWANVDHKRQLDRDRYHAAKSAGRQLTDAEHEAKLASQRASYTRHAPKVRAAKNDYYAANREAIRERARNMSAAVRESANNRFKPWTREEDDVVLDSDLTAKEKAYKLGRTIGSVNSRASNLRRGRVVATPRVGDILKTQEALDALPHGALIECSIAECYYPRVLRKVIYNDPDFWIDHEWCDLSGGDDWTPELPARFAYEIPEGYAS